MPKIEYKCLWSALIWFAGNSIIGLAPLLFLIGVSPALTKHKEVNEEITVLLKGGIILFVCCALMGAVMIEILIEKIYLKKFSFFAFNVFPFIFLLCICFFYLLKLYGIVATTIFSSVSRTYILIILFTFFYCTIGKYLLYKKTSSSQKTLFNGNS